MKKKKILSLFSIGLLLASCDAHDDHEPPTDIYMHIGDIVCTDGSVVRYEEYKSNEKTPTAVVFYVNNDGKGQGKGYAVCLSEINSVAFTDSVGVRQGTSCSITDYDGNLNTYALFNANRIFSPMAEAVNEYLCYGQSAYIPSVAQMQLMYHTKPIINKYLKDCGGVELPRTPNGWYWTSTEVKGQSENKAWLYSITSGSMMETSKLQEHRVRPIITIW